MCDSIKIYFVDPDWRCICIFNRIAHYHKAHHLCPCMDWVYYFSCKKKKKVCGCHRASCGSFLLGWHAGVVLCLRASWDIMWAYQVATRVSGGVWVTEGLLILELYHFLPLSSDSGRHGVRQAVRDYTVETEYLSYVDKKTGVYRSRWQEHWKWFDVDYILKLN